MRKASDNPIQYGQQEAYEAFEWLRQHATTHGAVALCEWHRLALENKRLTADLADIRRQAGDATEYVLAQINREQARKLNRLQAEVDRLTEENRHLRAEVYE